MQMQVIKLLVPLHAVYTVDVPCSRSDDSTDPRWRVRDERDALKVFSRNGMVHTVSDINAVFMRHIWRGPSVGFDPRTFRLRIQRRQNLKHIMEIFLIKSNRMFNVRKAVYTWNFASICKFDISLSTSNEINSVFERSSCKNLHIAPSITVGIVAPIYSICSNMNSLRITLSIIALFVCVKIKAQDENIDIATLVKRLSNKIDDMEEWIETLEQNIFETFTEVRNRIKNIEERMVTQEQKVMKKISEIGSRIKTSGRREFLFGTKKLSWHQAQDECVKWGGHLVTVRSPYENNYFVDQMKKRGMGITWIGINDEKVEGEKLVPRSVKKSALKKSDFFYSDQNLAK